MHLKQKSQTPTRIMAVTLISPTHKVFDVQNNERRHTKISNETSNALILYIKLSSCIWKYLYK